MADQLEAARVEVDRLSSIGDGSRKTNAEARIIARSSDKEWLGDELFRLQQVAFGAQAERDALSAEVGKLQARLSVMTDAAAGATADANRALEREQAALTRAFERTTKSVTGFDYTDVNDRLDAETTAFPTDEDLP